MARLLRLLIGVPLIALGWVGRKFVTKHDWRGDPSTEAQQDFADSLGIVWKKSMSKGELSALIDEAKEEKRRATQMRREAKRQKP